MSPRDPFGLAGHVLDARYRIDRVVGEGGFGVVYYATQVSFEEPVAVKVLKLPGHLSADQHAAIVATFHAEGKHLRKLSAEHPAFVRALDTGVVSMNGATAPYLVLEWLNGEPLETELLARRRGGQRGRSLSEALACLEPIFDALSCAHRERVAHRDVKPANIFLVDSESGRVAKLLDFGMAKVMTATGTEAFRAPTQGGIPALSPTYAAPEQWSKKLGATGPWTDVYALALILVEMLTDLPALQGDDMPQLMAATMDPVRPTPTARGAVVAPVVEGVFAKALAIAPKERFPTADRFWTALVAANRKGEEAPREAASRTVAMGPLDLSDLAGSMSSARAVRAQRPTQMGTTLIYEHPKKSVARRGAVEEARPATNRRTLIAVLGVVAVLVFGMFMGSRFGESPQRSEQDLTTLTLSETAESSVSGGAFIVSEVPDAATGSSGLAVSLPPIVLATSVSDAIEPPLGVAVPAGDTSPKKPPVQPTLKPTKPAVSPAPVPPPQVTAEPSPPRSGCGTGGAPCRRSSDCCGAFVCGEDGTCEL